MNFLSYDNPVMVALRRFTDYCLLGILWIIASLPMFTFGAATTAAFQTAESAVYKDEGRLFSQFVRRFKTEFKQATLLWLLELLILTILALDLWVLEGVVRSFALKGAIYIATLLVFMWVQLWFGYLSKFEDKTKTLLGNTFRMMIVSFGRAFFMALLTLAALVAAVVLFLVIPPIVLVIPGIYLMIYTGCLRKFFARYIPEEEPAPEDEE